jgi:hypothetical protein
MNQQYVEYGNSATVNIVWQACLHTWEAFVLRKRGNLIRPSRAKVQVCRLCDEIRWTDPSPASTDDRRGR